MNNFAEATQKANNQAFSHSRFCPIIASLLKGAIRNAINSRILNLGATVFSAANAKAKEQKL
jgi:hypothetical protein